MSFLRAFLIVVGAAALTLVVFVLGDDERSGRPIDAWSSAEVSP